MNAALFFSVILKGIGALMEFFLQILITNRAGLAEYGIYTTWISMADLIFWCLFSGLIKCNTFYLSKPGSSIRKFKSRYYIRYALPVIFILCVVAAGMGKSFVCMATIIAFWQLMVLDQSSSLLAERNYVPSLLGEYILGRIVIIGVLLLFWNRESFSTEWLVFLYLLQYIFVFCFLIVFRRKRKKVDVSENVSVRKWAQYQRADIMQSMVGQMPVILQFFAVGAAEAGVTGIVLLVKKLVNFISGPAAKIFLPQFSQLYHQGKKDKICDSFASIMQIQMVFVCPLAVVLTGYPTVVMKLFAAELVQYTLPFVLCAGIFLFAATLGPCGGLMQMSGNEKVDNHCREAAIGAMLVTFLIFRKNTLFAVYGFCVQTLIESVSKYIFVCHWLKQPPVGIRTYLSWWVLPGAAVLVTHLLGWQESFIRMVFTAGVVFLVQLAREWKKIRLLKGEEK